MAIEGDMLVVQKANPAVGEEFLTAEAATPDRAWDNLSCN